MRDVEEGDPRDLVGWAKQGQPVYHQVKSLDEGGLGYSSGISLCGVRLECAAPQSAVRPHERACKQCEQCVRTAARDKPERAVARVRNPLVLPMAPVGPFDLRVSPDGHLAIAGASGDPRHPWLVVDMENPLLITVADDLVAQEWPTLRSLWPTEELINGRQLADKFEVERSTVAKWRNAAPGFPRPPFILADRPGWYEDQLVSIEKWVRIRAGRTGRPPNNTDNTSGTP